MKKTYFIVITKEKSEVFLKTNEKTVQSTFLIDDYKYRFIYNSCRFSFEKTDIEITPFNPPYDDIHYSIFRDQVFCGYNFEWVFLFLVFCCFIFDAIDDYDCDIVFCILGELNLHGSYQKLNEIIRKYLGNDKGLSFKGIIDYDSLLMDGMSLLSKLNNQNYLFVNDFGYNSSFHGPKQTKRTKINIKNEFNETEIIEQMKYTQGIDYLSNKQLLQIFMKAYYESDNEELDICVITRDRCYLVSRDLINDHIAEEKNKFSQFLTDLAYDAPFICYLDISHHGILAYTKDLINEKLLNYQLYDANELFYDFIFAYANVLLDENKGMSGALLRKRIKRSNARNYFLGDLNYFIADILGAKVVFNKIECRNKEQLLMPKPTLKD